MAELRIRPYQQGDEHEIVKLFGLVFGRPLPMAYWQWRFRDNPTGRIFIDLAWDGERLAGHYAVSPVVIAVNGQEQLTALSMTTMTHPDYRGKGLFVTLAQSVYQRMADQGLPLVWGFPNVLSHRGFIRDLAWQDIHEVPTFRRVLSEGRPLPAPSPQVVELPALDARCDPLWAEIDKGGRVLTRRDHRYLAWRYTANPENRYTFFGCQQGERLLGYAVCKRYQDGVDLVDLLSLDEHTDLDLVWGVARWAAEQGARSIQTWLNPSLPLHLELEKYAFRPTEPLTYFGARPLRPELEAAAVVNFRNWYITMGDSDVY